MSFSSNLASYDAAHALVSARQREVLAEAERQRPRRRVTRDQRLRRRSQRLVRHADRAAARADRAAARARLALARVG